VSDDKKKLEAVGVIGESGIGPEVNGDSQVDAEQGPIRGYVNDISVFERGDRGKDGVCVIVAVGKEHRMGRWNVLQGKNGSVVFEIPRVQKTNGVAATADEEE